MPRFRLPSILLLALFAASAVFAASPARNHAVTAELVAHDTAIQPGRPFWVALKMVHEEHWHSYWINAGTGYPTTLEWDLPAGFKAGDIVWSMPHVVRDTSHTVTGLGYEGVNFLFVRITPPAGLAPGTNVALKAKAAWLMCKDVCMPGEAALVLTLPVESHPPAPNAEVAAEFDRRFAALPAPDPAWTATVSRTGRKLLLHLVASGTTPAHEPTDLHFFDRDGLLDYVAQQPEHGGKGDHQLELTLADDAKPDVSRLVGVLSSGNGWHDGQGYAGITIDAPITAAGASAIGSSSPGPAHPPTPASPSGFTGQLLLALVGGMILNLMPCVFPVLGIKILGFVNQAGHDRRKVTLHGLAFAGGVLLSFWLLAGILLALRAGGEQLGWGFQLQSPAFVFSMTVFLLIFALNMSGLFEFGLAATAVGGQLQTKQGFAGSFFTGALATLVATPCSAPFLAPALGAALSLGATQSLLLFTAIAIGLALPYLLLSIFPQAVRLLPRPGAWMETFKQLMAFPLYATVGALVWVLAGQTRDDDYALLLVAFGLVLVAMGGWVYGRFGQTYGKPRRQRFGRLAAVALLAAGVATGWPQKALPPKPGEVAVTWEKWSPQAIAAAQAAGHYVYVDFTARWCATCQTNKAAVFHSDEVLAEMKRKNVVLLRGDWTSADPAITAELARWGRSAVPFDLIYAPGKPDPVVLPELLTPGKVLDGFAEAGR
ncbi:MAG TPA: thioredoxin family protein [Candidatus Didemnitutus sp.]|jgi:thiol:disulfide interchange protein DsbD